MTATLPEAIGPAEFAARMHPLGPWDAAPHVAVAVSGGADSLALALLASGWGRVLALIVDHGLRAESTAEAQLTRLRLLGRGIPSRILTLSLPPGPALAARARAARYAALRAACVAEGLADLLLGHHLRDQAETVLMRRARGSGPVGLAAMPAIQTLPELRLLRPLLAVPPGRLRATLAVYGESWIEDPSNARLSALRPRLRALLADAPGTGQEIQALSAAAMASGAERRMQEADIATTLAQRAVLRPEGFAVLAPGPWPPPVLAALLRVVSGAPYPPPSGAVARLAAQPMPATLAGTRLLPAGRLGPGWLLVREAAAMRPAVPACPGATWDGRFRLPADAAWPDGAMLGPLGRAAAGLRRQSDLPAAVLVTLPAIWHDGAVLAVPHLAGPAAGGHILSALSHAAAGAAFVSAEFRSATGEWPGFAEARQARGCAAAQETLC